ncbi:lantibiotic dehydratase [Nonomuraea sp. NPDC052265]|uniref:lantibiotic dehydratase n=1 Tax=Nonomuraea sp. NPDC052265 TaxID=3364374 RepID=UPI0037CC717D
MSVPPRYRHTGLVMVRGSTDPGDLELPACLDLHDPAVVLQDGRAWLAKTWARSDVREALQTASPDLAARVDVLLGSATASASNVRRATASFLLRWRGRPTPFGLFAGIATAGIGPAAAAIGTRHQAFARVDADWITGLIDQIEQHPGLRPRLTVVANNLGIVRDDRFIVASLAEGEARAARPVREISVRLTRPVRSALETASAPVPFSRLVDDLVRRFPRASEASIVDLLSTLIGQRILITNLRPPLTIADPLPYLIEVLHNVGEDLADVAALLLDLEDIRDLLARHNSTADAAQTAAIRATTTRRMAALAPQARLTVDVGLDAWISVPEAVLEEAAHAATVLLRIASEPFGRTSWMDYRARFLARYGPGALVPVNDLVADSGLGFPGGYFGAARARPTWRTLTDRDAYLLTLIQNAIHAGTDEITLTDADITALTVGDPATGRLPERLELGVELHAASTEAINRGEFALRVVATPSAHASMAGRFAPLLDDDDRARLAASYRTSRREPNEDAAVAVQLSFPPRSPRNENVVRVPQLLPAVLHLGGHPASSGIDLGDLAVTADSVHMHLVQRSTGRRVIAHIPHALDTVWQTPPLVRFLAEITDARSAVFKPLNPGAARLLTYLPRIRYRRTVLAAARWLLATDDVHGRGREWDAALQAWQQRWRTPAHVLLCHADFRLPLDLDQPVHRAVLRRHLKRAGRVVLQEGHPPRGLEWLGRPAELLIPMTTIDPPPHPLPVTVPPGRTFHPGASPVVCAHLTGPPARFDDILVRHLPAFADDVADLIVCWWVRRHRDMIQLDADQHLAVFLRLTDLDQYGPVAARLAAFAAHLETLGLPAHLTLAPYHEQPGRYGDGDARTAAEHVFAADTRAAIAQIDMAATSGLSGQALAAASMTHLAAAFAPDPTAGYRALVMRLEQQTGPLDRTLRDHALHWANPAGDYRAVRAVPGGEEVAAAWRVRDAALTAYHHALALQRDPATVLRTLLHDHHVRALGVDPEFEKVTDRLARAAALRHLALAGAR